MTVSIPVGVSAATPLLNTETLEPGFLFGVIPTTASSRRSGEARASKDAPGSAKRRLLDHPSRPVAFANGRLRMRALENAPIAENPTSGVTIHKVMQARADFRRAIGCRAFNCERILLQNRLRGDRVIAYGSIL